MLRHPNTHPHPHPPTHMYTCLQKFKSTKSCRHIYCHSSFFQMVLFCCTVLDSCYFFAAVTASPLCSCWEAKVVKDEEHLDDVCFSFYTGSLCQVLKRWSARCLLCHFTDIKGNPLPMEYMNMYHGVNGTQKLLSYMLEHLPGEYFDCLS